MDTYMDTCFFDGSSGQMASPLAGGASGIVRQQFGGIGAESGVKHTTLIKESVTGRYLALLIGNNDYRHWPKLKTAVRGCPAPCSTLKTQVK